MPVGNYQAGLGFFILPRAEPKRLQMFEMYMCCFVWLVYFIYLFLFIYLI